MNEVTSLSDFPVAPYLLKIAPYVAGRPISEVAREFGLDESRIVKLASNENPLGMPPSARRAMEKAFAELSRYPDANGFDLKAALSRKYGVATDWLTLGNGSNDILELAAHAFLQPGRAAVFSEYAFIVYGLATQAAGARSIVVPATAGLGHDLDAMLGAITADTQIVFVANPNNPTGTFIGAERMESFLASVPSHVIVVLDEAYNEYLLPELRFDSTAWVREYSNVIVSRTFSKAFGLAGLRVGYAIAQPVLTDLLNRIRQPFNVNALAQAAACAALDDTAFLAEGFAVNQAGYAQLCAAFDALGLDYIPSFGNFVLVRVGDDADAGARINLVLLKAGIIVRPVSNYGLPQWLRISVGLAHENAALIEALAGALKAQASST